MTPHGFNRLAALAYLALLIGLVVARREPPEEAALPEPITALPENSAVVLTVDLERLRATELGRQLLSQSSDTALPAAAGCQSLLQRADRLAGAMPRLEHAEDLGVLGVAFSGRFERSEIQGCVRRSLEERGLAPSIEQESGFTWFGSTEEHAGALALRDDGLLLGAPRSYLHSMIAAANRVAPNVRKSDQHRLLRELVGVNGTLLLSAVWDMPWFPGVRAAALRADFSPRLRVELALRCDDELRCAALAARLRGLEDEPMLKLAGLALPRGSLQVEDLDGLVRGSLDVQVSEARPLLRQAFALLYAPGR
ncbi:MAG: hypothetical protein KC766_29960 [Myxococcales bacterium]|nr:hypothetical protein [Myxococcales bacterium]